LVTFDCYDRFYNPSRANPNDVTHMVGPNAPHDGKIFLSTTEKPTDLGVALSVIMVNKSFLHKTETWRNGKICKSVSGKLLSQEDTLWASLLGMALNFLEIKGPIQAGWITFSCRPLDPSKSENIIHRRLYLCYFLFIDAKSSPAKSKTTSTSNILSSVSSDNIRKSFNLYCIYSDTNCTSQLLS
jgi:hypothetical protein